jgi:hypothetical protein
LETISDSKKSSANLNRFDNGQRISIKEKPITHGINHNPIQHRQHNSKKKNNKKKKQTVSKRNNKENKNKLEHPSY